MASDPGEKMVRAAAGGADNCTEVDELTIKAERCRRLVAGISDRQAAEVLRTMAANYEQSAARLSRSD